MKVSGLVVLSAARAVLGAVIGGQEPLVDTASTSPSAAGAEKFLVETAPGETRWVSEDEKWELRRNGINFMDITRDPDFGAAMRTRERKSIEYPKNVSHADVVNPLVKQLSESEMRKNLEKFSSFHTRYYKSDSGRDASNWLFRQVEQIIKESGAEKANVESIIHSGWEQRSIIARIPGRTNKTVVIGAHLDSINLFLPSIFAAPGADDDGSGTVTILEAMRVLLKDPEIIKGNSTNTIEFHWYSAEEGGLLGSQDIFSSYARQGIDVVAMLQQDMTGYIQGTISKGNPQSVGVIMDNVDPALTAFIKTVIDSYCTIPWVETKCGYECSDHASASKAGYPSAFVIESAFEDSNKRIHTTEDKIEFLDFGHMLQHARMTLGFAYELAYAKF